MKNILGLTLFSLLTLSSYGTSAGTGGELGGEGFTHITANSSAAEEKQIDLYELQEQIGELILEEDGIEDATVIIAPPDAQVSHYSVSVMLVSETMTDAHKLREIVIDSLPEVSGENIMILDNFGNIW